MTKAAWIDEGGPAFPVMPPVGLDDTLAAGYPEPDTGMTLRDYFAAKALQALISRSDDAKSMVVVADKAYMYADAMLEARK